MKHSSLNHFWYLVKNWFRWDTLGTLLVFAEIPVAVLLPIVTAMLPRWMVNVLSEGIATEAFAVQLGGWLALIFLLSALKKFLNAREESFQAGISMHYAAEMMDKLLRMRYQDLESYEGRAKYQRCRNFAFEGTQADGAWAVVRLTGLMTSIVGIAAYAALFSSVSGWLLAAIFLTCGVEYLVSSRLIAYGDQTEKDMVRGEMQFSYFYRLAIRPQSGQDIRLSGAAPWLLRYLDRAAREYMSVLHRYTQKAVQLSGIQVFCTILRDAVTFWFLVHSVLQQRLPAADFLFYFALTTGFSDWLGGVSGHITSLKRITRECGHYRDFMAIPDSETTGGSIWLDSIEHIEFRHVTFAYPTGETVLRDISFSVAAGESVALIGENGAGKTTLIKLLCGLYAPTAGEILVNGVDLAQLNRERYFQLTAALFQDYTVLPLSIADNILLGTRACADTVQKLLEKVGLAEKYDGTTRATALSGGERQRLLLARALYKNAPLLILDEPTAALDPLAEEQLYRQYRAMAEGKLSIFISHRLASTRFCDRVLFLSEGSIVEEGSHEELMAAEGAYRQMFDTQACYYREGVTC